MGKTVIIYVFFIFLLTGLCVELIITSNKATAQNNEIIVEDAEFVSYNASLVSTDLVNTAKDVTPRVVVEYGESILEYSLEKTIVPANFAQIIAEYTDSVFSWSLERPPAPLTSPPITNVTLIGETGLNGWFTSDVKVNMSANVPVEKTEYSLDNVTWFGYTDPFVLTSEGYYHLYYRSIDKAGNIEPVKEQIIKIDKTPPSGFIQINEGALYTDSRKVALTLNATDITSGVSQMRFYGAVGKVEEWMLLELGTSWEPFSSHKNLNLTFAFYEQESPFFQESQNITATVYAQFMDNAGLVSTVSDTIIFMLKIPAPVSLNEPANITKVGINEDEYYSVTLTWSKNTDPDFLCYEIIWYVEPLQPTTGYVEEWYFKPHETQGGEQGRYLIHDQSVTSFKIKDIPTWCTRCYFLVRTFNKQWIYSDSNLVVAEFPSGSSGILPYTPWPLSTFLLIFGGISGISLTSFVSYRIYKNWKNSKHAVKHVKGEIRHFSWAGLLVGASLTLIPILYWIIYLNQKFPLALLEARILTVTCGFNLFMNSIMFNQLLFKKTTRFRRLITGIAYYSYFGSLIYANYVISGADALNDPWFIGFSISVLIPVISIVVCSMFFAFTAYTVPTVQSSLCYFQMSPVTIILMAPFYLIPLVALPIAQKVQKYYDNSRAKLVSKLFERGEKYYNKGKLIDAAKQYAKAILASLKTDCERIDPATEQYIYIMKNAIYEAMFTSKEKKKENLKIAIKLQQTLKNNKLFSKSPQASKITELDPLLEQAQEDNLDAVIDYATDDRGFSTSFLEKTRKRKVKISELAAELGYDVDATRRLLQRFIEKNKIDGIITLDGQRFISKHQLRQMLREKLKSKE